MSQMTTPPYESIVLPAREFNAESVLPVIRDLTQTVGAHPPFKVLAAGAVGSKTVPQQLDGVGAAAIVVDLQVVNARLRPCFGHFLLDVWISETEAGVPGGVQTVGPPSVGGVQRTEIVDQAYVLRTTEAGRVVFEVTAATGTLWLLVGVAGVVFPVKLVWS
jgi:hypothetical protein